MRRLLLLAILTTAAAAQIAAAQITASPTNSILLANNTHAIPILVEPTAPTAVRTAAQAFAADLQRVTSTPATLITTLPAGREVLIVGVLGQSPLLDQLIATKKLDPTPIRNQWESALTVVIDQPFPNVPRAVVITGSDRRGAAFALFTLSRQMGVSPWTWWADVPVQHRDAVYLASTPLLQHPPSVQYRGIFLNDEDWGLRPWAGKKMDPELHNIGPHTYARIFELLLRLHANSLWPAMHPGTLAFNAVAENARLADDYAIVMGSSHSEALLRNNVGEWDEKRDGPWNYQTNHAAMDQYWDKRLRENGRYENFYTVGLRGVHDSGLEATGTVQVKARLVEDVITKQRQLLQQDVNPNPDAIPQVVWLYKESLDLYRAGMKVHDSVTLGWTDDNYGYLRQLSTPEEQKRAGGAGVYYHVSYWGSPHDYLWLCTTPPAQIREEMTKAYDHNARKYWVLNIGDLKPAELDIDYFMQLAWDEPATAKLDQTAFLTQWLGEQFPMLQPKFVAEMMNRYYQLNFIRKPEFMGFNGYDDGIHRTEFNPFAWGTALAANMSVADQNNDRAHEWQGMISQVRTFEKYIPKPYADAFFELVQYPVEAAAQQNLKFLAADRSFIPFNRDLPIQYTSPESSARDAQAAYDAIQTLTAQYNSLHDGKWDGMMDAHPRKRQVFDMPVTAKSGDKPNFPPAWSQGTMGTHRDIVTGGFGTVSFPAARFSRNQDTAQDTWQILPNLGISSAADGPASVIEFGQPGLLANQPAPTPTPWLEYDFTTATAGEATLALHLLPTSRVDAQHSQRYGVFLDDRPLPVQDLFTGRASTGPIWQQGVLRNDVIQTYPLGPLAPGKHTLRLVYIDPGLVFQHIVITFPGAPPAYPVPPETTQPLPSPNR